MNKKLMSLLAIAGLSFSLSAAEIVEEAVIVEGQAVNGNSCQTAPCCVKGPRRCGARRNCCPAPAPVCAPAPRAKCCPVPRQRPCVQRTICCPRPVRSCPKPQRCMPRNKPVCKPAAPCDTGCVIQPRDMSPVTACDIPSAPQGIQPVNMSPVCSSEVAVAPVAQNVQPVRANRRQSGRSQVRPTARKEAVEPVAPTNPSEIQQMTYASSQDTQNYMQRNQAGSRPYAARGMNDVTMDVKE